MARSVITRGLWVDEAMSVAQAKMSFPGMIHHLSTLDVHPPLSHALLWVAIRLFGSGETAVRLPSILLGTLMIPAMYLAGRDIYDRRTGLVAAAVGAVAPVAVWYSQEARMYSVLMLLSILAVWAQFLAVRGGAKRHYLLLGLFQAGIAWTMYLGVFFVIAQQVVMLFALLQRRKDRRELLRLLSGWAVSIALLVVLVAPLVPYVWTQAHGPNYTQFANTNTAGTGGEGLGIGLYTIITNGVWAILGYHSTRAITSIVAMWPVGVLAALLLLGRGRSFRTMALVALVLIPGFLLYLQGLRSAETFTLRYLSAVVPVLFLLVARLITRVVWSDVATWLVTGALIVCLSFALVDQQLNGENPRRYDFREALQAVTREAGPDDVIVYAPTYLRDVITYYAPDIPKFDATGDLEIDTPGSRDRSRELLRGRRDVRTDRNRARSSPPERPLDRLQGAVLERPGLGPPMTVDSRLEASRWAARVTPARRRQLRWLIPLNVLLAGWYFGWLLQPQRIGNPYVYTLLVVAELFNLVQALGYWWTMHPRSIRLPVEVPHRDIRVDVFIPTYNEPLDIVEPTIRAAMSLRSADVEVWVLDDGHRPEMEWAARRLGARYVSRPTNEGAKAGNINYAFERTTAPFIAVFDCDHVPYPRFLEMTLGHFNTPTVAYVQTPQYYSNAGANSLAGAAWSQQALFFGPICQGKDSSDAIFCCGTNFVMRRAALEDVGGFPTKSITEDFLLSIELAERGWSGVYEPEVLANGLAPEDLSSYVNQQRRWATGCIASIPRVLRSRTRLSHKVSTLLSATYFLSGWAILVNMLWPVVWVLTGALPLAAVSSDRFLLHFAPYFAASLVTLGVASDGRYTWNAYSLACSSFAVQISSTFAALRRKERAFVVTPKHGDTGLHLRAAAPPLIAAVILAATAVAGIAKGRSPANINNVDVRVAARDRDGGGRTVRAPPRVETARRPCFGPSAQRRDGAGRPDPGAVRRCDEPRNGGSRRVPGPEIRDSRGAFPCILRRTSSTNCSRRCTRRRTPPGAGCIGRGATTWSPRSSGGAPGRVDARWRSDRVPVSTSPSSPAWPTKSSRPTSRTPT